MHACRLCGRTLTTLGNLHMYMEGGHMRMGLCVIHKELIEELRQDIAAAFTCLSGLILRNESGQEALSVCPPHCPHVLYALSLAASVPSPALLCACRLSHGPVCTERRVAKGWANTEGSGNHHTV